MVVLDLSEDPSFPLISGNRLNIFDQSRAAVLCSRHYNILMTIHWLQYAITINPAAFYILHVVEKNETIDGTDELKIPEVGKEIRLHEGDFHAATEPFPGISSRRGALRK